MRPRAIISASPVSKEEGGVLLCLSEVLFDFLSIHGRDPWGERVRVGRPDSWDMSSECNMRVGGK